VPKGLLPGRGVRPIPEPDVPKGLLPGRGPIGRGGIDPGFDAGGVEGLPGVGGALKVAAAGPFGASGFASTVFGAGVSTTVSVTTSATSSLAVFGAAFLATFFAAGLASADAAGAFGNSARSFRATGASIDDDAPLTNSPNSASLAITTLLSTPRSFAIS
jgi:hypothetical protein